MGSLMAGWDSPPKDPNHVKVMRNKSVTKDGIEEYWKLKKKIEEEHLQAISASTSPVSSPQLSFAHESQATRDFRRSSSLPDVSTKDAHFNFSNQSQEDDIQDFNNYKCWWTRSNWAFLNEPPVIAAEVPKYKYASQHHVANLTSSTSIATN